MSFDSVKGQDGAIQFLRSSLKSGRLSHAYIFSGPAGVGKSLAAVNFAKALACKNLTESGPCDNCVSCQKIENMSHPDVSMLRPKEAGGAIRIDDIRQLIKDIYLRPFEANKKVYIIEEAQSMKHEAANALLKTLEEPPTDSIIILITDNLKNLFHTIVSRSQVVRFYPLTSVQIKDILVREYGLDENKAHTLSRLASGSLGEAIKYKDEEIFQKRASIINSVSRRSAADLFPEDIDKDEIRLYLNILLTWFRDILNTKAGAPETMIVNADFKDIIVDEAGRLSFEYLEDAVKNVVLTMSYLDQNANQKLAMSVLTMRLNVRQAAKEVTAR